MRTFLGDLVAAIETGNEVLEAICKTHLSDLESWRWVIQSVLLMDRKYLNMRVNVRVRRLIGLEVQLR
jgi:hypothetical protein